MIVYTENLKESTKQSLELIRGDSKVIGFRVNIQTSIAFLYTSSEKVGCIIKNTLLPPTLGSPK